MLVSEAVDLNLMLIKEKLQQLAEKAASLPGRNKPLRLTGDLEHDLDRLGDIDTQYLDSMYSKLNDTGLYRGNNEVFRTLYGRFRQIKQDFDNGGARPADMIDRSLTGAEEMFENIGNAFDQLDEYQLAEFYAGGCALTSFVKDYCLEHYSQSRPDKMNEEYVRVIKNINAGTVTASDFNRLIEATDKSTRERLHRRTRENKPDPAGISLPGRVVPKKSGRNDPPHQGRGRRYAAGSPAKERQNADQRRRMTEALAVITSKCGLAPAAVIADINNDLLPDVRALASAILCSPAALRTIREGINSEGINGDWLYGVVLAADGRLLADGATPGSVRLLVERTAHGAQEKGRCWPAPTTAVGGTTGQGTTRQRVLAEKKGKKDDKKGGKGKETREYSVTGKSGQLDNLEKLLKWIEYCGNVGHSGTAEVSVDGDGAAQLKFGGVTAKLPDDTGNYKPEVKVGIA